MRQRFAGDEEWASGVGFEHGVPLLEGQLVERGGFEDACVVDEHIKAAVHMLTQAMAKAFAPEVTVNCVAPGWIDLDDAAGGQGKRFAAKTPVRRNGTAEEVAQAVLFFASGPAFITGQILAVDGGLGL